MRPQTQPIGVENAGADDCVVIDDPEVAPMRRRKRLRTAVGTTPPDLRDPDLTDGVPIEVLED